MKNRNNNIIASRWLKSTLILVMAYFSLVNPLYHLHYFHQDGLLEFEISSLTNEVDATHLTDHHHHDGNSSHTNNHQHTYDKHIDWHIIRIQNPRTLTLYDQYFFSSIPCIITDQDDLFYFDYKEPPDIDDYYASSLIIRGPPLLG